MSVENEEKLSEEQGAASQEPQSEAVSEAEQEEVVVDATGVDEASATGEDASDDGKNWKAEVEKLEKEVAELKDQAIRAKAEVQNIRRRAEQDVEKAHKFALERFAKELLPVIDGLEKAVEAEQAAGNEMTPLREGVEMTLSMFLSGVQKFNLEQVDPVGQPFDPALHEAMSMVPAPDAEPNTVVAAMQKGYTLNGRLVRPAMVVVSK